METYRLSSKLREENSEYVIETANNAAESSIRTTVLVNGVIAEQTLHLHPEQIQAQEVLSLVKSSHGEKKRELEMLLGAYRSVIDQGEPDTMFHLGTAFFYKGFCAEARELFFRAANEATDHHQAFNHLGMTELLLRNADEAVQAASRAVDLRPRFADYRNNLGEAYLEQKDWRSALKEFTEAIQINMYYADAYFNSALARIVEAEQDQDQQRWPARKKEIETLLDKATLIYDGYRDASFERGTQALINGELDTALNSFQAVREVKRESTRKHYSALHLNMLLFPNWVSEQVISDRIGFLRSEINKNPSYVDLQAELSLCYLEQAKLSLQKAIDQYRKTAEINPSLRKVTVALTEAEKVHESLEAVLARIAEKG